MNVTEIDNVFHCDCGFSWQQGRSGSHDCDKGLRAQRDDLLAALELLVSPSMSSLRGNGETLIGWQVGDGMTADERLSVARAAIARAKGGAA